MVLKRERRRSVWCCAQCCIKMSKHRIAKSTSCFTIDKLNNDYRKKFIYSPNCASKLIQ